MNNTLEVVYNKLLIVEETIQALALMTGVFKEHYDRDAEKEIHHLMLVIHNSIESVGSEMKESLSAFDEFLVEYK